MLTYDDGSTTDGSISILGDHEFYLQNHKQTDMDDADDLSLHTPSPQPSHLWLRCTPVDMTICSKRSLAARSHEPYRGDRPKAIDELTPTPNIVDDILGYLERLNTIMANTYLMHVLLLFITGISVAMLTMVYSRYNACKMDVKDVQKKMFDLQMDMYQLEGKLSRCEYRYETDVMEKMAATLSKKSDQSLPAVQTDAECDENDVNGECIIQPTKLVKTSHIDDMIDVVTERAKIVWTGEGNIPLATKMPFEPQKEYDRAAECYDEHGLFHEYNREYCANQNQKPTTRPIKTENVVYEQTKHAHDIIYPTQYSYKTVESASKCDPSTIDLSIGLEPAKQILRDTNCDNEDSMKKLKSLYDLYMLLNNDEIFQEAPPPSKQERKQFEINKDKSKKKREKVEKKSNHDRNDENNSDDDEKSSEERDDETRRDKKYRKDKESRKQRKNERESDERKKYGQDKELNKWNKNNERKRDMIKVYDHRSHD